VLSARVGVVRALHLSIHRAAARSAQLFWLAGTMPGPYPVGSPSRRRGLQGVGRTGGGLSDVGQTTSDRHLSARTTYVH
jgi:hypothetical protein